MPRIRMTQERFLAIADMANETIGHWEQVVAGTLYYRTTVDCPACKKYLFNECEGCPIYERTGSRYCERTPVIAFQNLHHIYKQGKNWEVAIEVKAAAQDCLDFLLMLQSNIVKERLVEFMKENV